MSITQQYALDLYRATKQGTPPPPAPGTRDWQTVRELREMRWPAAERRPTLLARLRGAVRGRRSRTHCAG